jgi:uncharacterized membrane protein (DUF485 family)
MVMMMMMMMMMTLVGSFRQVYGSLNAAAGMKTYGIPIACVLVVVALMMMAVAYWRERRGRDNTVSGVVLKSEANMSNVYNMSILRRRVIKSEFGTRNGLDLYLVAWG